MEAKYDKTLETGVRNWIEATTGESIGDDFQAGLKNGQILCKYVQLRIHVDLFDLCRRVRPVCLRSNESVSKC
jgi:hypothetical protein